MPTSELTLPAYLGQFRAVFSALLAHLKTQLPDQAPLADQAEAQLQQMVERLQADLTVVSAHTLWQLRDELRTYQLQSTQLQEQTSQHQDAVALLEDRRVGDLDRVATLQEELNIARNELRKSVEREQLLYTQLLETSASSTTDDWQAEKTNLEAQLFDATVRAESLEARLIGSTEYSESLEQQVQQFQQLSQETPKEDPALELAQQRIEEWTTQSEILESQLAQQIAQVAALQGELAARTPIEEQTSQLAATAEVETLHIQLTERDTQLGALGAEFQKLGAEVQKRTVESQWLEAELSELTLKSQRLEAELAERTAEIERLEAELAERPLELAKTQDPEAASHTAEIANLQEQLAEYTALQIHLAEVERLVTERTAYYATLEIQLAQAQDQLTHLQATREDPTRLSDLRTQLEFVFEQLVEAQTQVTQLQAALTESRQQTTTHQEQLAYLEGELTMALQRNEKLNLDLAQAQQYINELESQRLIPSTSDELTLRRPLAKLESETTFIQVQPVSSVSLDVLHRLQEQELSLAIQREEFLNVSQRLGSLEEQYQTVTSAQTLNEQLQAELDSARQDIGKLQLWVQKETQRRQSTIRALLEDAGLDPELVE